MDEQTLNVIQPNRHNTRGRTDNFSYDWYVPGHSDYYKIINFTYMRVLENFVLLACAFVVSIL